MGFAWDRHGFCEGPSWGLQGSVMSHGVCMGPHDSWGLQGSVMWSAQGLHGSVMSRGVCEGPSWGLHGFGMGFAWVRHGVCISLSWGLHEVFMGPS